MEMNEEDQAAVNGLSLRFSEVCGTM